MNKQNLEMDDIDREIELMSDDYPEPEIGERFFEYRHKLWERRFGYQEDKTISFEENMIAYVKFNYEKGLIKKILDMKSIYFYETGKII